jgi:signal transduction histidine kinase
MNELQDATLQWLNDLTAQGILTTDAELRIQSWNRWMEIHSGYQASDVIGRSVLDIYPDLIARRLDQWYQHALSGQVMVLAHRLHGYLLPMPPSENAPDLAHMQQSARIAPLTAEGRIIGTITIISDVTERETRESELRRQITTLEALYEVSQSILSLDLPECLQRLVDTTAELFQAPTVAVVLRHNELLHLEACTYETAEINTARINMPNSAALAVIRSGQPQFIADITSKQQLAPLDPTSQSLIATPLIAEGSVIGALIIEAPDSHAFEGVDRSHVMMLATQAAIGIRNAQLYREAQEAIRVRDTFLSIASHELKTPLTTILGNAQMLQRRSARENSLNTRDKRSLDVMTAQAARLSRMVAALLDISRIQTGQLSIERAPLDLCLLAQRVVDDLLPTLDKHQIALSLPDEALIVEGDELRLEQVLQNLLQNAVKYSPQGGTVDVRVEQRSDQACVVVGDQGIGIPAASLPQLFRRFYRAENVQAQHISGIGVGLYVVKEIVDLHDGQIDVASEEGVGSTFTICLPIQPVYG